jgi:flagellar M-ring protein FliF
MTSFWQEVLSRPREVLAKLSRGQRMGVLALFSVGIVVAVLASLLAGRESWAILYGGLEPQEASEICSKLTELGVPYRLSPDSTAVQVPEEKRDEAKMQLFAANLPRMGSRGFDLFDENQLGLTDSIFNIQHQRALNGEIERAIGAMQPVKKAHVLVTLPESSFLTRDQIRPSASVVITVRTGMRLSDSEVSAIAYCVAASVGHGIRLEDVKITDQEARLLHPRGDGNDPTFSVAYLQGVQMLERNLQEKAESQLRAAFGENKAAVRVSVELDRTHKETAIDRVDEDNKVPVHEVKSTELVAGSKAETSTAPGKSAKEPDGVLHDESETQFREGAEKAITIEPAGAIRRLTVSVLLDESDETIKAKQKELEALVKSAVGFDPKRGDLLTLALAPFVKPPPPLEAPGPFALENLLPLLGHVAEAVTVLFVLLLVIKALRGGAVAAPKAKGKALAGAGAAAGLGGPGADQDEDLLDLEMGEAKGADLRHRVGRFVNRHPDQAREVLVAWLKEELA